MPTPAAGSVVFVPAYPDVFAAYKLASSRNVLLFCIVILLSLLGLQALVEDDAWRALDLAVPISLWFTIVLLIRSWAVPRVVKRFWRQQASLEHALSVTWDGEGLSTRSSQGQSRRLWPEFMFRREDDFCVLFYRTNATYQFVPKRVLSPAQLNSLESCAARVPLRRGLPSLRLLLARAGWRFDRAAAGEPAGRWYYASLGLRSVPQTEDALRALWRDGTIGTETPCRRADIEDEWRPLGQTGLLPDAAGAVAPCAPVMNGWAWLLAVTPLVKTLIDVSIQLGTSLRPGFVLRYAIYGSVILALLAFDSGAITRSGRSVRRRLMSPWLLVPPVYLWRRATRFGQSRILFWLWLDCSAIALTIRLVFIPPTFLVLPGCASPHAVAVASGAFDVIAPVRHADLSAVRFRGVSETGLGGGIRRCRATVIASNQHGYPIDYWFKYRGVTLVTSVQLKR